MPEHRDSLSYLRTTLAKPQTKPAPQTKTAPPKISSAARKTATVLSADEHDTAMGLIPAKAV
ncbi:hypothetical protein [Rubripirellula tenax]|uniref:hypothetical protein n=1 Tax=Rubripirellula tenax TaxID=2528015 RepID=UPI001FE8E8DB|nr:hypothetical protein [Rubripirellula tenax]